MVIKKEGWWWRSYSLGGGVALFGRLNALLGCVWHASCHGAGVVVELLRESAKNVSSGEVR